uniref:Uncharacterized protein n=1 Tax=Anopheles farauti TaxID=69004 RepID=A0A182Q835_9DIPT
MHHSEAVGAKRLDKIDSEGKLTFQHVHVNARLAGVGWSAGVVATVPGRRVPHRQDAGGSRQPNRLRNFETFRKHFAANGGTAADRVRDSRGLDVVSLPTNLPTILSSMNIDWGGWVEIWHSYSPSSSFRAFFIRSAQLPRCRVCSTRNRSSLLYVDRPTVSSW